ncbi:MAG TPA: hypothetical protein VFF75_04745 [Methylophilaceae bacterium]|jgi:hypothetical protein|nr:hypothetical protein [Methylophilaceae bacterium]
MISKNLNKIEDVSNYLELAEFSEEMIFKFGGQEQEQRWMDIAGDEFDIDGDDYDVEDLIKNIDD